MRRRTVLLFFFFLSAVLCQVETRSREEINTFNDARVDLGDIFACKRLFTTEEAIGCGSNQRGTANIGRLFEISSLEDLEVFDSLQNTDRSVLISLDLLVNPVVTAKFVNDPNLNVILVSSETTRPSSLTQSGLKLTSTLFPQAVAMLSVSETLLVRERIAENAERGFNNLLWNHGATLEFYNGVLDVTSDFCLSLGECDPIGGQSVWGTVGGSPSNKSSILLAVKLDSTALFHDRIFAARDVAGPLAVFLAVADSLSSFLEDVALLDVQIIFAAFQGETFDGVGSKRFIFDVQNSCSGEDFDAENDVCSDQQFLFFTEFNALDLDNLDAILILDNLVAFESSNTDVFIHTNQVSGQLTNLLTAELVNSSVVSNSQIENPIKKSFLEVANFQKELVILTAYESDVFEANPFHFTSFDTVDFNASSSATHMTNLAGGIAKTLVQFASGSFSGSISVNEILVEQLESTLTKDFASELSSEILGRDLDFIRNRFQAQFTTNRRLDLPAPPFFYPGVYIRDQTARGILTTGPVLFTRNFLALALSPGAKDLVSEALELDSGLDDEDELTLNCDDTEDCLDYIEFNETTSSLTLSGLCELSRRKSFACVQRKCVCSTVFFHDAVSPALDGNRIKNAEELPEGLKNEKVFTEPRFALPVASLFQHSRNVTEIVFVAVGSFSTILSYVLLKRWVKQTSETKYKLL